MVQVVAVSLLEARNVSKYFGGLGAVDGVNLEIEGGDIHAFRQSHCPRKRRCDAG